MVEAETKHCCAEVSLLNSLIY